MFPCDRCNLHPGHQALRGDLRLLRCRAMATPGRPLNHLKPTDAARLRDVQLDVHFAVCNHTATPLVRGQLCTLLSCSARGDERSAYGRGRPRKRHIPDILSRAAEDMLANAKWQNVSWRNGTKGRLEARFAAVRVRTADGPPQRIKDMGQQHLPGDEAWLIGEHRTSGEKKYYLANLPAKTNLRTLAATIKARWICEQAHQQLKEELGLDHFEGRSWQGLHRHALMTMIAYAFSSSIAGSKPQGGKKRINGPPPQPTLPAVRQAILELIIRPPPHQCPHCRKWICSEQRRE